jgi:hypothetical protein
LFNEFIKFYETRDILNEVSIALIHEPIRLCGINEEFNAIALFKGFTHFCETMKEVFSAFLHEPIRLCVVNDVLNEKFFNSFNAFIQLV